MAIRQPTVKCQKTKCLYYNSGDCKLLRIVEDNCSFFKDENEAILSLAKSRNRILKLWNSAKGKQYLAALARKNPYILKTANFASIKGEVEEYLRRYRCEFVPPKIF